EPTLALLWRGDLDDSALAPVRLGEVADLVDAFVEPVEYAALPAYRPAGVADALDRVPAATIGLPRHGRVLADLVEFQVALARLLPGQRIEAFPFDERPRCQQRR